MRNTKSVRRTGQPNPSVSPFQPPNPNRSSNGHSPPPTDMQLVYRLSFWLIFTLLAVTLLLPFIYPHEAGRLVEKFWTFIFGAVAGLLGGVGLVNRRKS